MLDDWWKYASGVFATVLGFTIKDAVRDGKMAVRMDTAEKDIKELKASAPCAEEIICVERRKECNAQMRREFDLGTVQFDKLAKQIHENDIANQKRFRENELSAQERHRELLMLIMKKGGGQ